MIAWGANLFGQSDVPAEAQSGVSAIAAGGAHPLAVKNGRVIAWGDPVFGQIRVPAEAQSGVTAVYGGFGFSLALKENGQVIGWGREPRRAGYGAGRGAVGCAECVRWELPQPCRQGRHDRRVGRQLLRPSIVPAEARSGVVAVAAGGFRKLTAMQGGHSLALVK